MNSDRSSNWKLDYPDVYNFPPFFTIQPVLATRNKQLELWRALIIQYCTVHKKKTLSIYDTNDNTTNDGPLLWKNPHIQRQCSSEAIQIICDYIVQQGYGEWYDDDDDDDTSNSHVTVRIFWRKPEQLATDIYEWAVANGYVSNHTVITVYELHSGEDVHGMSFQGLDEDLIRRALFILEQRGKCTVFQGDTSEEDGIKFS
jgi:ESCRT-II complex subunit VPS25